MMVGLLGGGLMHLRHPDGTHLVVDGMSTAPAAARADMYRLPPGAGPRDTEAEGRANAVGAGAVAVPGNLVAWASAHGRFGRLAWEDVVAPAIGLAGRGFAATQYLADCVGEAAADLALDPGLAALLPARRADRGRRAAGAGGGCGVAAAGGARGGGGAARRRAGRAGGRGDGARRRHAGGLGPCGLRGARPGAGARRLPRLRGARAAAAGRLGRARGADARRAGSVRRPRHGLRRGGVRAPAGRGAQARGQRPRGGDRRSRLRGGAGGAPAVARVCGRAARADRPGARARLGPGRGESRVPTPPT